MPELEASNEPRGMRRGATMVVALLVALPLLYLLSLGPVIFVMEKTDGFGDKVSWKTIDTLYAPIGWLYKNTFMKDPIDIYLGLWGIK